MFKENLFEIEMYIDNIEVDIHNIYKSEIFGNLIKKTAKFNSILI